MSRENPEQQPITSAEKEQKFFAERLTSPEDPRIEKVQEMLAGHFGKEEVDPIEVMKEAMTGRMETGEKVPPYLVHVAENSKGEIMGLRTGAVVETVDAKGKVSEKSGVLLGCYSLTSPEARRQGIWKELFKVQGEAAEEDAESRSLKIKGYMSETHGDMEPVLNSEGAKRAYIKTKEGFRELPYEQPPVDWNTKTGKPAEDAGVALEHLMLKLSSGENKLSGKELMEMVRGMYLYNNYREEEYFKNSKAYEQHTGFVKGVEQKLTDFIGKKTVYLLSSQEREAAKATGIKFVNHMEKEDKLEARKAAAAQTREKTKGWKEHFGPLTELWTPAMRKEAEKLEEEKKSVETAKIPEKGMEPEQILKESGIEKPAESFAEAQKRLGERLAGKISLTEKNEEAQKFYLNELGYRIKYDFLHNKARLFDEASKDYVKDVKGKRVEFKTIWSLETNKTPMIDFLRDRLKEEPEGKLPKAATEGGEPRPEKSGREMTEEEKIEAGLQKAVNGVKNEQATRVERISSLEDVKEVGRGRLEKIIGGLSYVAALDKLGVLGLRGGKKLAIEGGKDLAALGLTPAMILEQTGLEAVGRIQMIKGSMEKYRAEQDLQLEERLKEIEEHPNVSWPEHYLELLNGLKEKSERASDEMARGFDKLHKKGKIWGLLEGLGKVVKR